MKKIAVYGAGGFGREVACLINRINKNSPTWELVGFFDDGVEKGTRNTYGEVLGGIDELNAYPDELSIVIAIGSPHTVEQLVNQITSTKIDFPNVISPDVIILDENNFSVGIGNVITTGCFITCNVKIGNFNILNGGARIGHDTKIGNFNSIMPSVNISGEVTIGDRNFLGVDSTILQQIKIGNDTVIGANSLILRNTKDGMTYMGNPARIVKY